MKPEDKSEFARHMTRLCAPCFDVPPADRVEAYWQAFAKYISIGEFERMVDQEPRWYRPFATLALQRYTLMVRQLSDTRSLSPEERLELARQVPDMDQQRGDGVRDSRAVTSQDPVGTDTYARDLELVGELGRVSRLNFEDDDWLSRRDVVVLASIALLLAYVGLKLAPLLPRAAAYGPRLQSIEQLLILLALINALVYVAINPLREDRVPDRFPSILQDAIVVGVLVILATFVFPEKLLTTSAVGAVVIGFALQDTLGNMFAGLAIQVEKPFIVGHWVKVGGFEGRVQEVTWRATKLST